MRRYTTIFARVRRVMFTPAKEWKVISEEKRSVREVLFRFLIPFLILTMIACYIGYGIVGSNQGEFGLVASEKLGYHYAFYYALLFLISISLSAFILSFVAPFFKATNNYNRNFRYVTYSFTPTLLATFFLIVPFFKFVVIIAGFYNTLLFYIGLNRMPEISKEKKLQYFGAAFAIIVFVTFSVAKVLFRMLVD